MLLQRKSLGFVAPSGVKYLSFMLLKVRKCHCCFTSQELSKFSKTCFTTQLPHRSCQLPLRVGTDEVTPASVVSWPRYIHRLRRLESRWGHTLRRPSLYLLRRTASVAKRPPVRSYPFSSRWWRHSFWRGWITEMPLSPAFRCTCWSGFSRWWILHRAASLRQLSFLCYLLTETNCIGSV